DGAAVGSYVRTVMRNAATRAAVEAAYWFLAASPAELTASLFDAVCRRAAEGGAQVLFALDTGPLASIGRPRGLMPTNGGLRHYTYNWRVAPHPARDIDVATV
ncbi:MAG TPA: hypothetical protein VJ276_13825, partial [Thermoanaerobaculia bacterium]|nr:hypothetical protein [Thermoanaerobaculia bacterium]